jgi:hypothetical protein
MRGIALGVLALSLLGMRGFGQGTLLTNRLQFKSSTTVIDFEMFPDGLPVPYASGTLSNQWLSFGVFISDSDSQAGASAYAGTHSQDPHSGTHAIADTPQATEGGFILLSFFDPDTLAPGLVTEAGLWVQNGDQPSTVTFFDAELQPIETVSTSGSDDFVGMRYAGGIAAIQVTDPDFYLVDDVEFGTIKPLPIDVKRAGRGRITAQWPAVYQGFTLQVARHFNRRHPEKSKWQDVDFVPTIVDGNLTVTNRIGDGKHFRLVAPQ